MAEGNVTSVLQAASAGVKDMADGSLRITFEFEPRHAAEAFALFGPRGRAVAIAALRDGFAAVYGDDELPVEPVKPARKDTRGPLCREACDLCKMPDFWEYVRSQGVECRGEPDATEYVHGFCGIGSRKDLDSNGEVAEYFRDGIRVPFIRWQRGRTA
jgi:hypothetical protein